jgi:predicted RNA-binding protein with TRAM domain
MVGFRRVRRFKGPRVNLPKPINVGEEYDVEIDEIGSKGDGIARVKNFVVFVENTKKGEKAHIKIKEVRNRFAIGEKIEVKEGEKMTEEEKVEEEEKSAEEEEETEEPTEEPEEEKPEEGAEESEETSEESEEKESAE